jgi:hypothetical protein
VTAAASRPPAGHERPDRERVGVVRPHVIRHRRQDDLRAPAEGRGGVPYTAPRASEQLCPPKPKLLLSTLVTRTSRATFGM